MNDTQGNNSTMPLARLQQHTEVDVIGRLEREQRARVLIAYHLGTFDVQKRWLRDIEKEVDEVMTVWHPDIESFNAIGLIVKAYINERFI
jgi:lauroyl/myristoyl acyltransferase